MNHTERLLTTLSRNHLQLTKRSLEIARDNYAAFVITIHPMDFLKLTTMDKTQIDIILKDAKVSLDSFNSGKNRDFNKNRYYMPYLSIYYPSGEIFNHEGRHRAARVLKAGGTSFPVSIICYQPDSYKVTWEEVKNGENAEEGGELKEKIFYDKEDFVKFYEALKSKSDDWRNDNSGISIYGLYHTIQLGSKCRRHPEKRNWTKEDFPEQLVSQFNPRIIVPRRRIKVGIVKGYIYR